MKLYCSMWVVCIFFASVDTSRSTPRGLPEPPKNNDTDSVIALGKLLFNEPLLSSDGTVSCATCHDAARYFTTADAKAIGIRRQSGRRNAPALVNRIYGKSQFWDGRVRTLEEQAVLPLEDPLEMGHSIEKLLVSLQKHPQYSERFRKAFGSPGVTKDRLATALAAFQRSILLGNSPVDAFIDGDTAKLSESAKQGLWLFESRAGCWKCHAGKNYSDEKFHNTGVSWGVQPLDLGRYEVTKQEADKGRFKTPTLRGVAKTAPYMHDGSIATLEDVVTFYSRGGNANPNKDGALEVLNLSKREQHDLVEFLKALSEEVK